MKKIYKKLEKIKNSIIKFKLLKKKKKQNTNLKNIKEKKQKIKQNTSQLFQGLENLPNEEIIENFTIIGPIYFSSRDLERIQRYFNLYDETCEKFNSLEKRFPAIVKPFKPHIVKQNLIPVLKKVQKARTEAQDTIDTLKMKYETSHSLFVKYFDRLSYTIHFFNTKLQELETLIINLKQTKTNFKKKQKHR